MKPVYTNKGFWIWMLVVFLIAGGVWALAAPYAFQLTAGEAIISGAVFAILTCGFFILLRFTAGKIIEKTFSTSYPQTFLQSIKDEMEKLKYGLVKQEGDASLWRNLDPGWDIFLDQVHVEIAGNQAVVSGPKRIVNKLVSRF